MAAYTLYFLNSAGLIVGHAVLQCESDEEADLKARALQDGRDMELWDEAGVIKRYARREDA